YAGVSVFLHITNVILVYIFIKKITSNEYLAFLTAILFGISASSYQSTSWVLADVGIHMSAIFIILSLVNVYNFVNTKTAKYLYLSIAFLTVSLLFKEIGLGLFGLLPIIILFFGKLDLKAKKRSILSILTVGGLYLIFRFIIIFMPAAYLKVSSVFQSQPAKYIFYNLMILPLLSLTQSIIPPDKIIAFLKNIAILSKYFSSETLNSTAFNSFLEGQALFIVCVSVSLILILIGLLVFLKNKKTVLARYVFLGILLVLVSSPIFALSPERLGIVYVLDSRNLYIPVLGSSIFVVIGLFLILKQNIKKTVLILLPFLLINIYFLSGMLDNIARVSSTRKNILGIISKEIPILQPKTIFYTESDKSFYGLPERERILPFQSGFGQTLLIWYFDKQQLPKEFLENRFLWELTSEGYKEFQGTGFGYFRNFEKMANTLVNYNLPLSSVISFRYDSKDNSLEDMSQEVGDRIKGYLANKKLISAINYKLTASVNNKDILLAKDGNINTFWSSQIPYAIPQDIDISFKTEIKIAQIQIDFYNNKDQNYVGYKVSLVDDSGNWHEVFYAKRYPPNIDGIVNLYFEPTETSRVKIEQVGYHPYTSWVIHELRIYETVN
ncbi:MAG: discoidin domain-containing protein, partial [Patescibacteria group bacterium]